MTDTPAAPIAHIHQTQREFFATHATRPVAFRIQQLTRLRTAVQKHERRLLDALHTDLHKGATEAYFSEIGITQSECSHALAHVGRRARPQRVWPALVQLPSSCWVYPEPLVSFDAFSHRRSVLKKRLGLDPWFRWLPYSKTADRIFRWLLR